MPISTGADKLQDHKTTWGVHSLPFYYFKSWWLRCYQSSPWVEIYLANLQIYVISLKIAVLNNILLAKCLILLTTLYTNEQMTNLTICVTKFYPIPSCWVYWCQIDCFSPVQISKDWFWSTTSTDSEVLHQLYPGYLYSHHCRIYRFQLRQCVFPLLKSPKTDSEVLYQLYPTVPCTVEYFDFIWDCVFPLLKSPDWFWSTTSTDSEVLYQLYPTVPCTVEYIDFSWDCVFFPC